MLGSGSTWPRPLAAVIAALATWTASRAMGGGAAAPIEVHGSGSALTAQQALDRVLEGNARFVAGKPLRPHQTAQWRAGLTAGQHPIAAILGCSDSRVPLEVLLDQGFGDLFVIRVAGNVVAEDERGSIEYAVAHLGVPLVLVMGHEQCGAVSAAFMTEAERKNEPPEVLTLLDRITPALARIPAGAPEARIHAGVEANARRSMGQLLDTPLLRERVAAHRLMVKSAVYELGTSRVRILD